MLTYHCVEIRIDTMILIGGRGGAGRQGQGRVDPTLMVGFGLGSRTTRPAPTHCGERGRGVKEREGEVGKHLAAKHMGGTQW